MRLLGWIDNAIVAAGVLIVLVLAPIAAVYQLATGHLGGALVCVGLFVAMSLFALSRVRRRRVD